MNSLPVYDSFSKKMNSFKQSKDLVDGRIDTIDQFDKWYKKWEENSGERPNRTTFFRGMGNASHKLFTSAQRAWNQNETSIETADLRYRDFFAQLMGNIKTDRVLSRVSHLYGLNENEFNVPALSLVQHYGGFTPLMDWTHSINIALYFAIEKATQYDNSIDIGNYVSVYRINNERTGIRSLSDVTKAAYPSIRDLMEVLKKGDLSPKRLFYYSDFEENSRQPPLTTLYNQNIVTQNGLFIFNPSRTIPLEDYFPKQQDTDVQIRCYDIHKSLAGYVSKKLTDAGITKEFIYPNLNQVIGNITSTTFTSFFKHK